MISTTDQVTPWGTDRLLTPAEVASHLGIKVQTLYAWRVRGNVGPRAIRVGKYLRYVQADLLAWQESQVDPAAA